MEILGSEYIRDIDMGQRMHRFVDTERGGGVKSNSANGGRVSSVYLPTQMRLVHIS